MGSQTTFIPALLERERELEELARAMAGAREGAGRVVLVEGPAGVGKSRLLANVRASAREAGLQVLAARGAVLERDFAFGVARQLFEQTVLAATGAQRQALLAGAAGLAERLVGAGGPGPAPGGGDAEFGALHGLYWLTANLADEGPLLLSVDDAHWADPSSLRFLATSRVASRACPFCSWRPAARRIRREPVSGASSPTIPRPRSSAPSH